MLWYITCVMLYNMKYVVLYNICHITCVKLRFITYVICYVI